MMDILIYILLCVITSVPYVYSVRRSLTPKYKSVRATLLYGLLICALMWFKLWLDFLKEDSLFTILFTQTMLFLLMKIFTKDSWVRVLKFFLIFSGSAVISELFCVLVFMGIGADIRSSKAVMYLPIGRFFGTISVTIFMFIAVFIWNKISGIEMNTKTWEFFAVLAVQIVLVCVFLVGVTVNPKNVQILQVVICVGAAWVLTDGFFIKAIYDNQQKAELKMSLDQAMQLEKMQYEYYENLTESVYSMRKFRHDMNNTLQTLSVMMNDPDSPESRENGRQLFEQMQEKYKQTQIPYYSSNPVINAVILSKSLAAEENGVKLTVSVNGENLDDIENIDLCSIFSNLLDNALEAARNIRDGEIELSSWSEAGYFFIKCVNSYAGKSSLVKKNGKKLASTKGSGRGLGLSIIESVAGKYDGRVVIDAEEKFSVMVGLKVAEKV